MTPVGNPSPNLFASLGGVATQQMNVRLHAGPAIDEILEQIDQLE